MNYNIYNLNGGSELKGRLTIKKAVQHLLNIYPAWFVFIADLQLCLKPLQRKCFRLIRKW